MKIIIILLNLTNKYFVFILVPINKFFRDFGIIEKYLQEIHGLTSDETSALGISRIYESPQVKKIIIRKFNQQKMIKIYFRKYFMHIMICEKQFVVIQS
jgi:hypothetical protein